MRRALRSTTRALALLVLAAALVSCPSAAGGGRTQGIDVSRFNGLVDWQRVAASGVRFAFVEASRGSGEDCTVKPRRCGADPFFAVNYREARTAGIRVGAYQRAFAGGGSRHEVQVDARSEAELFCAQVGRLRRGDLLPVLDVEAPFGGLGPSGLRLWVRTWLERVRNRLGERPIIYTNASSWRATGDTTRFADLGHPLWVAEWGVSAPSVPAGDWGGRGWSVWQFTSDGRVPGVHGRVDEDVLGVGIRQISVRSATPAGGVGPG